MNLIRKIIGSIVLFLDRTFTPESLVRSEDAQKKVDESTKSLLLYQLEACPFCVKVRREIKRLGLSIATKDIKTENAYKELMAGGKQDQVPCLRITEGTNFIWMYESDAINSYLRKNFGA